MRIAITGGSGALGRALITRLTADGADRIVTFSRDEQKREALRRDFCWHPGFRVMAGDVRDAARLPDLFSGCEVVIHAAARKVVTAHPDEPEELLKTNIIGTHNVIEAAKAVGVTKVVLVSSDKAVRAENVYGVSKAMGEHLAVMANARTIGRGLRVGVVRYGNVLGSTGSVLTVWRKQLAAGEPLTISDRRMTRFWITLAQAVDLVLGAVANLRGGEIVVPHLPAAPVTLLASVLGVDSGTVGYNETGIRQGGEKLHEELLAPQEIARAIKRNGVYVVPPWQNDDMWDNKPWLGERLAADFTYRSDTWPYQLTVDTMRTLLQASGAI